MLVFVAKNRNLFLSNSEIHNLNIQYNYNLHLPTTNLSLVQKGDLYKIFNNLPLHIKSLSDDLKHFKRKLKSFLIEHTLYSLDEFDQVTLNDYGFFVVLTYIRIVIVIQWYNPILFIAYVLPIVKCMSHCDKCSAYICAETDSISVEILWKVK